MSDQQQDRGPLRLPPERDVTPQLRARVLHQALREERPPTRGPARVAPILAGVAAAAVVAGIVYTVNHDSTEKLPITGSGQTSGTPAPEHNVVDTVAVAAPGKGAVDDIQRQCKEATGVDADFRMTTQRLKSPIGRIEMGAYANKQSADHVQVFCTPFGMAISKRDDNLVSTQAPIALVADSHVQGLLPTRNDASSQAYYDGAWFAVTSGVAQIEVRLVVDGTPGRWHAATRVHAFIFASTWQPLTGAEAAGEVTVQYRGISADGDIVAVPDIGRSTVTPADTPQLDARTTILP